jgi:hypothetical protein
MKRNRLLVLSSVALLASGAILFACSGGGDDNDSGTPDAAKDSTKSDAATQDAKADTTVSDAGADTGNDATVNDATLDTGTDAEEDAATDAEVDAGSDADDGSVVMDASSDVVIMDASSDGGTVSTFMVLRIGGDIDAGADAALGGGSTQAYLEQRNISDGSLVTTIALPTAADAGNEPFALQGNSTSEGSLTRSVDGHYVVVGGYGITPGNWADASVASKTSFDAGVPRVVARVDSMGNVDTTTQLNAFNAANIRGVASNDGTAFWATGSANDGTPYVLLSSTGTVTDLQTTLLNERVVQIFGGQVYVSSGSGAFHGVSTVGTGLPTTNGQTVSLLPGMPVDAGSAYGFSMLDLDGSVNGLDTLYIADDTGTTAGVQKWVFDGNTWTKLATFTDKAVQGFRGLTAYFDGTNVILLATTGDAQSIVKYTDDGVNTSPTGTVLATAPTNTAYRGIALSPQ